MKIEIASRYQRSIALDHDWTALSALSGYIVTPLVRSLGERIIRGLESKDGARAWSITGPFGTGKSSFALFLATILSTKRVNERNCGAVAEDVLKFRRLPVGPQLTRGLEPIFVTGERRPLLESVLLALAAASEELASGSKESSRLKRRITQLIRKSPEPAGSDAIECIEDLASLAISAKRSGLFFVFDEFGKFLEYAAAHDDADIFFLQQLAEFAGRSSITIGILTILHQSFVLYAQSLSRSDQAEWQKIEGRFEELAFLEPADQLVALAGRAIDASRVHDAELRQNHRQRVDVLMGLRDAPSNPTFAESLERCFPIAPEVALILGSFFRGGMAQNQRSLFAFLLSNEPGGFQRFAEDAFDDGAARENRRLYGLGDLYEYIATLLTIRRQSRQHERLWALAEQAIRVQQEQGDDENVARLKAIAVLERFGCDAGLRPTTKLLALVLGEDESTLGGKLADLRSVVVHRRHSDTYHFWDGSDVDLDSLIKSARTHVSRTANVAHALSHHMSVRPIVAARHLHATGTLRWLEPRFVDDSQIALETTQAPSSPGNGLVLYVLPRANNVGKQLVEKLEDQEFRRRALPHPATVVAVALDATSIFEEAIEMLALDHAVRSGQAVELDDPGRRELSIQLADAKNRLRARLARTFGWDGGGAKSSVWFTEKGGRTSALGVSQLASAVCDDAFPDAPSIGNELINRDQLSSAAARARRELLVRMVGCGDQENLGISGHPPELSMYLTVIKKAGLHKQENGAWMWCAPEAGSVLRGVWDAILGHLETANGRVGVPDLYQKLATPPIGLRSGPLPPILLTLLLTESDRVSLFEEGTLVPSVDEPTIERLLSRPGHFSIRAFPADKAHAVLLGHICRALSPSYQGPKTILAVVKVLLRKYRHLPPYALRAADVSADARRLRAVIESARDPQALVFEQIPEALGFSSLSQAATAEFTDRLSSTLNELEESYPRLVARILHASKEEFQTDSREQLVKELGALGVEEAPPDVQRFVLETREAQDDTYWAEAVAERLVSSPKGWSEDDFEVFRLKLRRVHEALDAYAELHCPGFTRRKRVRVAVRTPDATFMLPATITKNNQLVAAVLANDLSSAALRIGATRDQQIMATALILEKLRDANQSAAHPERKAKRDADDRQVRLPLRGSGKRK